MEENTEQKKRRKEKIGVKTSLKEELVLSPRLQLILLSLMKNVTAFNQPLCVGRSRLIDSWDLKEMDSRSREELRH